MLLKTKRKVYLSGFDFVRGDYAKFKKHSIHYNKKTNLGLYLYAGGVFE